MQPNTLSKGALLASILSGFALFGAFFFSFPVNSVRDNPTLFVEDVDALLDQEQIIQEVKSIGTPARLKIPVIGVDAVVIPVGLTSDGAMDVPKGPDEVAWFNLGDRPGEIGTAVMTGHYGWKNNLPAVFDNLHKLEVGDKIIAEDENGVSTTFIVREIRIYDKDASAPEVFGSEDGKEYLNLITCTGDWNKVDKSFSERLVVFAEKE
jgi:LPXTG-site transpeptidase (sortase) family protein